MNVRIGLYDFFAYTVPGGVYLFTTFYILARAQLISLNQEFRNFLLSLTGGVLIIVASYITGLVIDFFTTKWVGLFRRKYFINRIFDAFVNQHKNVSVRFQYSDWQILFAKIRQENPEIGLTIEQNNVTNVMLRSLSFGFAMFGVVQIIEFAFFRNISNLIFTFISALLSGVAVVQSSKFSRIFFIQIFEQTVARDIGDTKLSKYKFQDTSETPKKHSHKQDDDD